MNNIGNRIKSIRQAKNMTLSEMSKRTDISVSFLSDIENGRSGLPIERVNDIATVLDVSIPFLLNEITYEEENKLCKVNQLLSSVDNETLACEALNEFIKKGYK